MAAKRQSPDDSQLDLFSFSRGNYDNPDSIWDDGRKTLARTLPEPREGTGSQGNSAADAPGSRGEDQGRDVRPDDAVDETGIDPATGPRPGLGDGARALHPPPTGIGGNGELERNRANYRIMPADRIGEGSLKQKAQANLAAIRLVRQLESETRAATDEEKSVLVKYVGWGGIPQIFTPQPQWRNANEELASLLTEDEFRSARASTLNAHYTTPEIIQAMYRALDRLGFKSGRILEPACGIGHFIGVMTEPMHAHSTIAGIEIDPLTARIARALYPDADIRHQPFENAQLPDGSFDAAVSNIPFGDYRPFDPKFNAFGFPIHDYFFAAALETVRPGGLVMFVTSKGTLDKMDTTLRQYLSERAELIGAIRLPNTAFKRIANTEVTTDIVILKKVEPGGTSNGPAWITTVPFANSRGETIHVNEYFAQRPHMMLGEMRLAGSMYRDGEPALVSDGRDLSAALAEAIEHLPQNIYQPLEHQEAPASASEIIEAP